MRGMSWFELLLSLHILSAALWFGSGIAITVIGIRLLRTGADVFATFAPPASWWAGRAHPAAGVLLLLTGFAMVADRDYDFGQAWLIIALAGLVAAMGVGGALIGPTSTAIAKGIEAGTATADDLRAAGAKLLLYTRIEGAILVVVIVDMVSKPGA
jgi:hypothetical protein